jgi:arylsulfatase A-like enzyme
VANKFNRRDFVKLAGLGGASFLAPRLHRFAAPESINPKAPNILVILFDTFSANHISLHGYPRETTPKLNAFMDQATVYHHHIAAAPYTSTATASILTGTHAWAHRVFFHGQTPHEFFKNNNIFSVFKDHGYHSIAYTHNRIAEILLNSMQAKINLHIESDELFIGKGSGITDLVKQDFNAATQAYERVLTNPEMKSSLFFSLLLGNLNQNNSWWAKRFKRAPGIGEVLEFLTGVNPVNQQKWAGKFPLGLPGNTPTDHGYVLEDGIDWISDQLSSQPTPYLGYFHFMPPHAPYRPRKEFLGRFINDGYIPPEKPDYVFNDHHRYEDLVEQRRLYDEYILYVDAEFERLIENLEEQGALENTWVILTSDHGELLERGLLGHTNFALFHPLVNIPLIIKAPGQESRLDIFEATSAIDLLPTLLIIAGAAIPDWIEGVVIPPFDQGKYPVDRPVYSYNPAASDRNRRLDTAIGSILYKNFELIYSYGFDQIPNRELVELFDLENDPEEMTDIKTSHPEEFAFLFSLLREQFDRVRDHHQLYKF